MAKPLSHKILAFTYLGDNAARVDVSVVVPGGAGPGPVVEEAGVPRYDARHVHLTVVDVVHLTHVILPGHRVKGCAHTLPLKS